MEKTFITIGRGLLGLYFLYPGITKIPSYGFMVEYMTLHNIPFVTILLPITILLQVVLGLMLVTGYRIKESAIILAILTLGAALGGFILERFRIFGKASPYFQAIAYSATILFHMIPAITDFLRRLPVGDPFIDSFESPLLQGFHLGFLGLYVLGVLVQCYRLRSVS